MSVLLDNCSKANITIKGVYFMFNQHFLVASAYKSYFYTIISSTNYTIMLGLK